MFDFFTSILTKAVSAVASVIVAIGLMSAPVPEVPVPVTLVVKEVREAPLVKVESQEEKTPQVAQEKKKTAFVAAVNAVVIQKPTEPVVIKKPEEPKIEAQEEKPAPLPEEKKEEIETEEAKNEKAKNEAKQKFLREWAENPARKAIDAFLADPTIPNFQKFCADAKNLDGFTTKEVFNADRTAMIKVQKTLYEDTPSCASLDKDSFIWVIYTDNFLLPLDNSGESDELRKSKIRYNEKIKSLSEYRMFGFNGLVRTGTNEAIYTRPDEWFQKEEEMLAYWRQRGPSSAFGFPQLYPIIPEQALRQSKINFCSQTATYIAVHTEDNLLREQKTSVGMNYEGRTTGFCEEATKVIPPEIIELQGTITGASADDGSEFVKLTFTSPDDTMKKTQFFSNPAINKSQIDALVDAGWKIVDFRLSHPVNFGSR